MTLITSKEFAKATNIDKLHMPGLAPLLMEIMKINDVNNLVARAEHLHGIAFVDKVLQILGIKIEIDEKDFKNIPKESAFIAVANHPYGGIEGLILLKLLNTVRPESKLMANFILNKVPSLNKFLVPVNPFENIDHSSSISGLKATLSLLNNGTPIGIFPAGEVSTYKIKQQKVTDKQWHPVVGKIISKAKVTVLPVYFHGNNGLLFNLLSLIHPTLRTAKLASELFNKNGNIIKVRIGKPIAYADIHNNTNANSVLQYLRAKTYALGVENEKKIFNPRSLFKITKKVSNVITAVDENLLAQEVDILRAQHLVCTEKNFEVFITPTTLIPNIIQEIGRLREITFRGVGEGTNKSIDLDSYDIYYQHLFIWDSETQQIVGAYRIGRGDDIYYSYGKKGFYLNELFKIKPEFSNVLKNSLELGRSWIRKEYQLKPLPLFLLWKGILKYVMANPQYKYLVGPVSISNNFSNVSKSLIVNFVYNNHFDAAMADLVKPRKKFKVDLSTIDAEILTAGSDNLKSLDSLISEIETTHIKIPVLLRQYISLNAKIICFNIDPKFSNSLDGFLVLDIENIPTDMVDKLG
jgi:putative hemolysin